MSKGGRRAFESMLIRFRTIDLLMVKNYVGKNKTIDGTEKPPSDVFRELFEICVQRLTLSGKEFLGTRRGKMREKNPHLKNSQ